jgi:hypothetical protein
MNFLLVDTAAQCTTFNLTLNHNVCNITHIIPVNSSQDSSSGNDISNSLDKIFMNNSNSLPESCARVYVAFYCNQFYPDCVDGAGMLDCLFDCW